MEMICPKCAYARLPTDVVPDWQCPSCGIAYAKFAARAAGSGAPVPATSMSEHRATAPVLLCTTFIIAKSKLLQTSETSGAVLLTAEAMYFAKKGGLGALVGLGGIFGGAIGGVVAGAAATMVERYVVGPRLKAAGAVPFEQVPPAIQDYLARLNFSGDVVVLPRDAVREIGVSIWKGTYLKTESHLFELRPGLLEFSNVRKRLAFYKWL